jgi:predicted Zn finger-like uncharacterized protein
MSILVVCPGCHTRFKVSDKFAGQRGGCPKCKTPIVVPRQEDVVKVHGGELHSTGGKDAGGQLVLKPIEREKTDLSPMVLWGALGATVFVFLLAFMVRLFDQPLFAISAAGLLLVTPPLVFVGYWFLRDSDVLEPFSGKALWTRVGICSIIYAVMWAAYEPLALLIGLSPNEIWTWIIVVTPFMAAGAFAAFATFDLDFGSAFFHYCLFLLVTVLLRMTMGNSLMLDQ